MIDASSWVIKGYWGDANTPDLSMQRFKIFGTRESLPLSLNQPIAVLGGISSAYIWWRCNELKGTDIRVFAKLDDGPWEEVQKGAKISSILPGESYADRSLYTRALLTSTMTEIDPARVPELEELVIVFYPDKEQWDACCKIKLAWRDDG
jgi:hypothetical protein